LHDFTIRSLQIKDTTKILNVINGLIPVIVLALMHLRQAHYREYVAPLELVFRVDRASEMSPARASTPLDLIFADMLF